MLRFEKAEKRAHTWVGFNEHFEELRVVHPKGIIKHRVQFN